MLKLFNANSKFLPKEYLIKWSDIEWTRRSISVDFHFNMVSLIVETKYIMDGAEKIKFSVN